jgi:hypothetical protein
LPRQQRGGRAVPPRFGGNPFGNQLFAMRLDGRGLRQLTATSGMTTDPDGTVHVELPGPVVYSSSQSGS